MLKIDSILVLKNGRYFDAEKKQFIKADIAIKDGIIIDIGEEIGGDIEKDITGQVVVPGFMDGHCHVESSNAIPYTFAKTAVKHGTTTVQIDPHEAVNVAGLKALEWFYEATENLPVDFFIGLPSCVPASKYDMQGVKFGSKEMEYIYRNKEKFPRIIALAEVMDFQGLVEQNEDLLRRIDLAEQNGMIIDGHAPGMRGEKFRTYIEKSRAASDHECFTYEEALEELQIADEVALERIKQALIKMREKDKKEYRQVRSKIEGCSSAQAKLKKAEELGLIRRFRIMIREAGGAKNLEELSKLFRHDEYKDRLLFVLDDKEIEEIDEEGYIDYSIRKAISLGVAPEDAYMAATYNTAEYFGLKDRGEIAIGKKADLVVLGSQRENDTRSEEERANDAIRSVEIQAVYKDGQKMTMQRIEEWERPQIAEELEYAAKHTMIFPKDENGNTIEIKPEDIDITGIPRKSIVAVPYQIITKKGPVYTDYDLDNDVVRIAVMDSHNGTGKKQITYLKGIGLKEGAFAGTISHDSHYLSCIGKNNSDFAKAMNKVIKMGGGQVYIVNGETKAALPLEYFGLMSGESVEKIKEERAPLKSIKTNEGINVTLTSEFTSLCVIDSIRITPDAVVDVENDKIITQEKMTDEYKKQVGLSHLITGSTQSDEGEGPSGR